MLTVFFFPAEEVTGPVLRLWKVSRMDMGAYMCIARNGVPPAVSKRIELGIDCEYHSNDLFTKGRVHKYL